jgi:hypothetical protein
MPTPIIIDDSTPVDHSDVTPDAFGRGYVPRDFTVDPPEMFSPPSEAVDMSLDEIAQRLKEQIASEASLKFIRRRAVGGKPMPALDQNGQGFCWSYSNGGVIMLTRARDGQPYVRLSPHAVACKIKGFRDEGGWCGLSAKFARENGYPSEKFWPQKSMSRQYDTAETWANAALHKSDEEYVDLARPVYDQNLTKKQVLIQLVLNNPCSVDFNWWGHSVCALQALVRGNRTNYTLSDFGLLILNSWTDQWGDMGEGELWDSKSVPDGAVCIRSSSVAKV